MDSPDVSPPAAATVATANLTPELTADVPAKGATNHATVTSHPVGKSSATETVGGGKTGKPGQGGQSARSGGTSIAKTTQTGRGGGNSNSTDNSDSGGIPSKNNKGDAPLDSGPPGSFFDDEMNNKKKADATQKENEKQEKKGITKLQNNAKKNNAKKPANALADRAPVTAGSYGETLARQDGEDAGKYSIPERDLEQEDCNEFIVGMRFVDGLPEAFIRDVKTKERYHCVVANFWKDEDEKLAYVHKWKEFCDKHKLSELIFQGKEDPDGMEEWNSRPPPESPSKKKNSRKGTASSRKSGGKTGRGKGDKKGRGKGRSAPVQAPDGGVRLEGGKGGSKVLVVDKSQLEGGCVKAQGSLGGGKGGQPDQSEGDGADPGPSRATDKPGETTGVVQEEGRDTGVVESEISNNQDKSDVSNNPGGPGTVSTTKKKKRNRQLTQGVVNPPTSFSVRVATDSHGCKHCGIMDMMRIPRNEVAFYCEKGRFLGQVGTCSHVDESGNRCAVRFEAGMKKQVDSRTVQEMVFACHTGVQHVSVATDHTEECLTAFCDKHYQERVMKHLSNGGNTRKRRRVVT